MKVGVVGAGAVGSACTFALATRGIAREIVLVNRTRARARACATDIRYGTPVYPRVDVRDGDYGDLAGAELVMLTIGINEKTGGATDRNDPAGRLRLLGTNAGIYREIVPRVVSVAPKALLLVVTDPPDPLAYLTRKLARHERVLSAGTYIDSLRFRVHLADALGVAPADVDAQVIGEHGTSEIMLWSGARVGGVPVKDALAKKGLWSDEYTRSFEREIRFANISIIEGIGASQYGIGMVSARIAEIVLRDEGAVLPIGSYSASHDVTLSLPSVVGREGVRQVLDPPLSGEEQQALRHSIETLKTKRIEA